MKKFVSVFLVAVFVLLCGGIFASCSDLGEENEYGEKIDPNRTQLYIGNYYGGLGDSWLKELKRQYEELHPDVQILITSDKSPFLRDSVINNITTDKYNLYFTEKQYYYDLVNDGKIADITDIVTEKLTKYGEDVSIEDKITEQQIKDYYAGELTGGKYYALPTYLAHSGIIYDVDLFEDKGFFIKEGSTDANVLFTKKEEEKSLGADGIPDTHDDGMPATYAQFEALLTKIKKSNVTPFVWSGKTTVYQTDAATAWWVDYEGYNNFLCNYTFDGSCIIDGKKEMITEKNAYLLQKQAGKKYALQFVKDLISNPQNYTLSAGGASKDHLGAQYEYVSSYPKGEPVAMFLDSDWWENEARDFNCFSDMVPKYGSQWAYGTRRFAFMPIPKTEGSAEGETVLSTSATCCFFVNANSGDKMDLAKDFLQFCHTDNALKVFNTYTGMVRPYEYKLSEEEYGKLSYFSQYLYDMYKGDHGENAVNVVHDLSASKLRIENKSYFENWQWYTKASGTPYSNPFSAFAENASLTVDSYFNGLYTYHSEQWGRFGL